MCRLLHLLCVFYSIGLLVRPTTPGGRFPRYYNCKGTKKFSNYQIFPPLFLCFYLEYSEKVPIFASTKDMRLYEQERKRRKGERVLGVLWVHAGYNNNHGSYCVGLMRFSSILTFVQAISHKMALVSSDTKFAFYRKQGLKLIENK